MAVGVDDHREPPRGEDCNAKIALHENRSLRSAGKRLHRSNGVTKTNGRYRDLQHACLIRSLSPFVLRRLRRSCESVPFVISVHAMKPPHSSRLSAKFRAWLQKHHRTATELWVGYRKKATGTPSITWQESVDEALCFGWIDGIRKSVDAESYTNRFTPRRAGSFWSAINTRRAAELIDEGRMRPAGRKAFEARDAAKNHRPPLRSRQPAPRPRACGGIQGESYGLGVLSGAATRLQKAGDLVGRERETRRNPNPSLRATVGAVCGPSSLVDGPVNLFTFSLPFPNPHPFPL